LRKILFKFALMTFLSSASSLASPPSSFHQDQIHLKDVVTSCQGETPRLIDLVQKPESLASFDQKFVGSLKDFEIKTDTLVLTNTDVSRMFRLAFNQAGMADFKSLRLSIPNQVEIKCRQTKGSFTDTGVAQQIKKNLMVHCPSCEFEITGLRLPSLSEFELRSILTWNLRMRPELPRGSTSIPVEIRWPDRLQTKWIQTEIRSFRDVPVSVRALQVGERVSSDMVRFERREVTYINDSFMGRNDLDQSVMARTVSENQVLTRGMIRREATVRFGESLKALLAREGLEVSVEAVAQQEGFVGDTIRVRLPRTQKVMSARIVEKGLVEVQ